MLRAITGDIGMIPPMDYYTISRTLSEAPMPDKLDLPWCKDNVPDEYVVVPNWWAKAAGGLAVAMGLTGYFMGRR